MNSTNFHGSATCRRRHQFRALSMSRPLQHMQNLKPIFIIFRPWGIGQGRKIKNSVFLVMIIGTFGVNIGGNMKTGFGLQPRKISLETMAPLGRDNVSIFLSPADEKNHRHAAVQTTVLHRQAAIETTVLWKPPSPPYRLLHTDRVESSLGSTLVSKSL